MTMSRGCDLPAVGGCASDRGSAVMLGATAEAGFSLTGSVAKPAVQAVAQTDGLSDRSEGGFMNRTVLQNRGLDALKWGVYGVVNSGRGRGSARPVPCR